MKKKSFWNRLKQLLKKNLSLSVIIAAALLLELTTGVMYYSAQTILQRTVEQLVKSEMNAIALCIRKQLAKVEVAVNNMDWVLRRDLSKPDSMFVITRQLVENNPAILGSGICFKPDYYPQKGNWFEPYAVRQADGTIETMQLGSESHDYTKEEFYKFTMENDSDHWCEPYLDPSGARMIVTTYSSAVHDDNGDVVAVVGSDLSMEWLNDLMEQSKRYKSTRRFLLSRNNYLLAGKDDQFFQTVMERIKADDTHQGYVTMTDPEGEKQHVFYYPVGGITGWTLICVCSDQEIFVKLRQARLFLLLLQILGVLLLTFIVYRTSKHIERLHRVNAEKERIGGELRVASQIQQSMLPKSYLCLDEVELFGSQVPAREVGGDIFDYFIRDEKLFFCIGDVSGKGAPSAMLMAVTHSLFRAFSEHENNPAHIMQAINEASCHGNDSNMFVTLFIGVLDLPTGHMRYCDAGHDAPLISEKGIVKSEKSPTGVPDGSIIVKSEKIPAGVPDGSMAVANSSLFTIHFSLLPVKPHLPIGVFNDVKYSVQETQLQPDSTIFLYTDGLTEAKRAPKQMFGLQRMEEVLNKCIIEQLKPQQILESVNEEVHRFVGDAEQSDDLTMLAIRYTPRQFESTITETLILKNDVHEVAKLSSFQKSVLSKMNIETSLARQLRLAVEEAVVNVIDYAYPVGTEGNIEVRMMSDCHTIKIVIVDSGIPFDPTAKKKADTTLSAEDRQIGGLGILLVRELMDSINYERTDGQNVLTLVKKVRNEK